MKRRIGSRGLRWLQWLTSGRPLPAQVPQQASGPWRMPLRIDLRFRDGSTVRLDPSSPTALEIHQIADEWLTG